MHDINKAARALGPAQLLSLALVGFHVYTAVMGPFLPLTQRSIHLGLALAIAFLAITPKRSRLRTAIAARLSARSKTPEQQRAAEPAAGAAGGAAGALAGTPAAGAIDAGGSGDRLATAEESPQPGKTGWLGGISSFNAILAVLALVTTAYVVWKTPVFNQAPGDVGTIEIVLGAILLLLVMEAGRRSVGYVFIILTVFAFIYALFTQHFPGIWRAQPMVMDDLVARLYTTNVGIWGTITGISATQLAALLIFAGTLLGLGGREVLRDIAIAVAGRAVGGAGKVSALSSMLMGTISGSSAANAAMLGAFTIPMMKGSGYRKTFAAGVEATSSTFGQLMPPVMGAGAFLIAEFVGISYFKVMVVAILPAVIVYASVFAGVHFAARRDNLRGLKAEDVRQTRHALKWYRIVPIALPLFILVWELHGGRSADRAAIYATGVAAAAHILFTPLRTGRWDFRQLAVEFYGAAMLAARSIVSVAVLIATAQVVVSLVNATSIGVKFSVVVLELAGSTPLLALVLVMLICFILGMGLPTTAAYVVAAAATVQGLSALGIEPLTAHMFIFYFAVISVITPPVCITVFITASIAEAKWFPTSIHAVALSAAKYVLPFLFVFAPALLLNGTVAEILFYGASAMLASIIIEAVFWNYWRIKLKIIERVLLFASTATLYSLQPPLMIAGAALALVVLVAHYWRARRLRTVSALSPDLGPVKMGGK